MWEDKNYHYNSPPHQPSGTKRETASGVQIIDFLYFKPPNSLVSCFSVFSLMKKRGQEGAPSRGSIWMALSHIYTQETFLMRFKIYMTHVWSQLNPCGNCNATRIVSPAVAPVRSRGWCGAIHHPRRRHWRVCSVAAPGNGMLFCVWGLLLLRNRYSSTEL